MASDIKGLSKATLSEYGDVRTVELVRNRLRDVLAPEDKTQS